MFPVMTTYCLIHGSGQGPEGWKLLVHELEQWGHSVLTPAFEVNRTDQGLVWHAETIVNALDRSGMHPADVVCVAHSASGMYLPLIAERWSPAAHGISDGGSPASRCERHGAAQE